MAYLTATYGAVKFEVPRFLDTCTGTPRKQVSPATASGPHPKPKAYSNPNPSPKVANHGIATTIAFG